MKMEVLVDRFTAQLEEAVEIGTNATISAHTHGINKIYISGMGGSGIGANFTAEFVRGESAVPIVIGKGYVTPAFIDKHTLVICSSYSGNTEETLQSFEAVRHSGAKIVCITSGGTLAQHAVDMDLDIVKLPTGWPAPRACLGFSLVAQLFVLYKLHIISDHFINHLKATISLLNEEQEDIKNKALKIAQMIGPRFPIIYATDELEPVAVRLRQQFNENSKILAMHHVIPEMNHNELVGWGGHNHDKAVVLLRQNEDLVRNAIRIDICKEIWRNSAGVLIEVYAHGSDKISRSLYLVHLIDYITCYASDLNGADSMEIRVIDYLKDALSKV